MKYVLGIDLGITSVGWGIIDQESGKVVDAGVRLFSEATAEGNADRRKKRSARRLLRRRTFRLEQMNKLLQEAGLIDASFVSLSDPYQLRVRGLSEKLAPAELATAILHIAKRRGIDNIEIIEDDQKAQDENGQTTATVNSNDRLLQEFGFICKLQSHRLYQGDKKIRGADNRFRTSQYLDELREILSHQDIDEQTKEAIAGLIQYRRAYFDGPGSEKSPTPYGQWFLEGGHLKQVGMIDKMRGHCSVYPEEFRAPRLSYTACLFNLLNDLNNLEYDGQKMSPEQKEGIIEEYIKKKGGITPKQLIKYLGVAENEVKGFRINTKGEAILTGFGGSQQGQKAYTKQPTGYGKILNLTKEGKVSKDLLKNTAHIDAIIDVLSGHKDVNKRIEEIKKISGLSFLTESEILTLAKINGMTGYHALSYRAMQEMMDDLMNTTQNQMQILAGSGVRNNALAELAGRKTIPYNDEAIYSPVARRAQHEAVKVINAIRKQYGEMDTIVIEMARDKNSDERRDRIKKEHRANEEQKNHIIDLTGGRVSYKSKTAAKVRLYEEQSGKCLYTGKPIDLNHLIADPNAYEIDHIIPLSISFDDSLKNKTLCYRDANQRKGQRTPFQYFSSGLADNRSYEQFKGEVLSVKSISPRKREYLLYEKDITKYDVQKEFISRNLVDTQYASRAILTLLSGYFRANKIPTAVHTVRGAVTAAFRKKSGVEKDRDAGYYHHAVDALIVAGIKKMKLMDQVLRIATKTLEEESVAYHTGTGEVITPANETEYFDQDFINFIVHLRETVPKTVKYSHKIDCKPNRSFSDETIYGIKEIDGLNRTIKKYSNIYDDSAGEKVAKLFREGKAESQLLMVKHDPVTFALLNKIVQSYPEAKNPFSAYRLEHGPIRKHGKANGPIITSLRYDSGQLKTCMDISHKYQNGMGGKVVKLSLKPYRVDVYREGLVYKFLRITHTHIRKGKVGNQYAIVPELYTEEKKARGIGEKAEFICSLYKNDIFGYVGISGEENIVRFNGVYAYNNNMIEYKPLDCTSKDRLYLNIGKKLNSLQKYATDVLGQRYLVSGKSCKLKLPVLQ